MGNILLTSGGFNSINNYVSKENIELFEKKSKNKDIIIIANAAPVESGNYVARENVKDNFYKVGANKVDIIDLDDSNTKLILKYDIVYILGGNLQYLVDLNKKTDFRKVLINFLEKGIVIGESAGSMILADNVKWIYDLKKGTKPKYDVMLDSYDGLGLVDIYIYPHYQKSDENMKEKIKNYEIKNNIRIERLNDGEIIAYNWD